MSKLAGTYLTNSVILTFKTFDDLVNFLIENKKRLSKTALAELYQSACKQVNDGFILRRYSLALLNDEFDAIIPHY